MINNSLQDSTITPKNILIIQSTDTKVSYIQLYIVGDIHQIDMCI